MTPEMTAASRSCRQRISAAVPSRNASQKTPMFSTSDTTRAATVAANPESLWPAPPASPDRTVVPIRPSPITMICPMLRSHDHGKAGAARERDLPRRVERILHGVGHAQGAEERTDQADHEGQPGLLDPADVAELLADQGVLAQRGVQQPVLQVRVVLQHDVQHGDQHEHQREDAHEGEPGDQHGQVARLVVAELLPHRDREGQPGVLLLVLVHGPEGFFGHVHREEDVPGLSASIPRNHARVTAGHHGITGHVLQTGATN